MTRRILVVEDDPIVAAGLQATLEQEGWDVGCAGTAKEAFEGVEIVPDVVLLDVDLPDAAGLDVLKTMKRRWRSTPIIMMSGAATIDRAVTAMKLGAENVLQKPFGSGELMAVLEPFSKADARRVLVIDDDEAVAAGLQLVLEELGWSARRAGTARDALEQFAAFSPHLILIDVDLPDGSGITVLQQLKDRAKSTPIIMMSGLAKIDDAVRSMKLGAATFLQKPFDAATLAATIKQLAPAGEPAMETPESTVPIPCARCGKQIDRMFGACPLCHEPVTIFWRRYADQPVDGKYRLLERLGRGGMGDVYKVEHIFLRETRVIKVIRPHISEIPDVQDRFVREAQLAITIKHPNVATLHDFAPLPDGSRYMVWEFIDGENVAEVIRYRGVLAPRHAVRLIIQALAGLEGIHRAGVIHRDISPENLMIARAEGGEERLKIIDLGIAKHESGDAATTQTGMFIGKLRYAAPEQLGAIGEEERIDSRADLYSIAVVLYEMLTGKPPFEAKSFFEYIRYHSRETPLPPASLDHVPGTPELRTILARALERDRDARYPTAREFARALDGITDSLPDTVPEGTPRRPPHDPTTKLAMDVPLNTFPASEEDVKERSKEEK